MPDIPRRPDILILEGMVRGAIHDPELRQAGFGSVVRDIWGRISEGVATGTLADLPTLRDINSLVSLAAEQYRAEQELAGAISTYRSTGFDQEITAVMRARDIDTARGSGFGYPATDRIRFEITGTAGGLPITKYATLQPGIEGPTSVQSLLEMAEQAGQGYAEDYGFEFEGLGDFFGLTYV